MAKLRIETGEENTILRAVSTPILPTELKQYRATIENMVKHIKNPDNGGVGLAAPQIGLNKRAIVVSLMKDYDDETYRTIPMINPEIIEHSTETCLDGEGCLSVPGETGDVRRWNWIRVSYIDLDGKKYSLRLDQLAARIVQHEIDHLDGILFTDRVVETMTLKNS
jgi:peptide deformylase